MSTKKVKMQLFGIPTKFSDLENDVMVVLTQEEYDALEVKDENIMYFIKEE